MKLNDFEKANCSLWRLPPIDFSSVETLIEKVLVEAWQKGTSAQQAIDSLMSADGVSQLTSQLKEAMEYQQGQKLKQETEVYLERIKEAKQEEEKALREVHEKYLAGEERIKADVQTALIEKNNVAQSYNAAQESLEKTREAIYEKLKKVGGEEGLQDLLKINTLVVETAPKEKKEKLPKTLEKKVEQAELTVQNQYGDIKTEVPLPTYDKNLEEKLPFYKRIISKINAILNYRLW